MTRFPHGRIAMAVGFIATVLAIFSAVWLLRAGVPDNQTQINRLAQCATAKGNSISAQLVQLDVDETTSRGGNVQARINYWADVTDCRDSIK